jgi:acyl dehydratase
MSVAEHTVVAFLDGDDDPSIANPIHSTEVAKQYGYAKALVGGVTVYGWTVPSILAVLGNGWLDDGWVDVSFRHPTYPGDTMTTRVESTGAETASLLMSNQEGAGCLVGMVGRGPAPWLGELVMPVDRRPLPALAQVPELTLANAPIGQDLRPMTVPILLADAVAYALEKQKDPDPKWTAPGGRIHPGWIAARMRPLMNHSYHYSPGIHTRSQIQHMRPAHIGQVVTLAARFVEAYERKGHHYAVTDGVMLSEGGEELARLRHTTIFHVAKRD